LFAEHPRAQPVTGNDLLAACESEGETQAGFCAGYIVGAVQGMFWGVAYPMFQLGEGDIAEVNSASASLLMICEPEGVVVKQYLDITISYLQENPELRQFPARGLIHNALSEAFPC
jgi:hypothetical protein